MKVALVTNFLYPEGLGGTELYCYQLAEALHNLGNDVFWFVPNFNNSTTKIEQFENGVSIVRFAAVAASKKPQALFVAQSFVNELRVRDIKVAHFNEFGGFEGISNSLLDATKAAGIKTIVTLHLPYYICSTGTLRYGGAKSCDGKVIPNKCGSCNIFSAATPYSGLNYLLTKIFTKTFSFIDKYSIPVLPLVKQKMEAFKNKIPFIDSLIKSADVIVSLTQWFEKVLIINGIPESKIVWIPQASPKHPSLSETLPKRENSFVYIGRINKIKGIDLLLKGAAILKKDNPHILIDVFGPVPANNKHAELFLEKINNYSNIKYKGVLHPSEVMSVMSKYTAVLLPSICTEMAPMIIMEANKMKVPVIVSDVPGSSELTRQCSSGLIFKYNSAEDMVKKILSIATMLHHFKFEQQLGNDFTDVAGKYIKIYYGNERIADLKNDTF